MTTPVTAAPVDAAPDTKKPEATKPTSNWPYVSSAWIKDGDSLLTKITKVAICVITVPFALLADLLVKSYTWIIKDEEVEPEAEPTPTPTPTPVEPQPGRISRAVSYIHGLKYSGHAVAVVSTAVSAYIIHTMTGLCI